jgi:hypothetical protein
VRRPADLLGEINQFFDSDHRVAHRLLGYERAQCRRQSLKIGVGGVLPIGGAGNRPVEFTAGQPRV